MATDSLARFIGVGVFGKANLTFCVYTEGFVLLNEKNNETLPLGQSHLTVLVQVQRYSTLRNAVQYRGAEGVELPSRTNYVYQLRVSVTCIYPEILEDVACTGGLITPRA